VRAVRRTKCIANKKLVAQLRELARKFRVIGLFLRMKPNILEKQDFSITQRFAFRFGISAHTIGSERDWLAQEFAQPHCDRRESVLQVDFAFGAAEMGSEDKPRAAVDCEAQSRKRFADACIVLYFRSVHWDIEVHADEHAFAGHFKIADG
jgi:hypothetical protein